MSKAEEVLAETISATVRPAGRLTLVGAYRGALAGQPSVIIGLEYALVLLGATEEALAAVREEASR